MVINGDSPLYSVLPSSTPTSYPRRQDFAGEIVENGMFYFARRPLLDKGLFQVNEGDG
jgi:hypothetical protein